jgi:hypothetical protein
VKTIEADRDGAGPLTSPVTTYGYDARGNLISTVQPPSATIWLAILKPLLMS